MRWVQIIFKAVAVEKFLVFLFLIEWLDFVFSADQRIKPMILVVKKWARHHQINDASKGTLSSYTLVLMVLHYLQSQYKHKYTNTDNFSLNFFSLLSFCESALLFYAALKEPVIPSLQLDYPVSVSDVSQSKSSLASQQFICL